MTRRAREAWQATLRRVTASFASPTAACPSSRTGRGTWSTMASVHANLMGIHRAECKATHASSNDPVLWFDRLLYLRTNTSGTLKIVCSATCMCTPIRNYHQRRIYPFPIVHTTLRDTIKVTETTSFYQLRRTDEECIVDVLHADANRVRVDGIYVRQAEQKDVRNAANGSNASPAQTLWSTWARPRLSQSGPSLSRPRSPPPSGPRVAPTELRQSRPFPSYRGRRPRRAP